MALKLKIDKDGTIELALIMVNDVEKAKTWLKKNDFKIIDILLPIGSDQTTMISICGNKYNYIKIRKCKFNWLVTYAKNSNLFSTI